MLLDPWYLMPFETSREGRKGDQPRFKICGRENIWSRADEDIISGDMLIPLAIRFHLTRLFVGNHTDSVYQQVSLEQVELIEGALERGGPCESSRLRDRGETKKWRYLSIQERLLVGANATWARGCYDIVPPHSTLDYFLPTSL